MVLISLDIDEKVKKQVKQLGLRHQGVYMRGFEVIINKNSYEEAIEELKKKLERVTRLLDHYIVKSVNLEDEIKIMKLEGNRCKKKQK